MSGAVTRFSASASDAAVSQLQDARDSPTGVGASAPCSVD